MATLIASSIRVHLPPSSAHKHAPPPPQTLPDIQPLLTLSLRKACEAAAALPQTFDHPAVLADLLASLHQFSGAARSLLARLHVPLDPLLGVCVVC